MDHDTYLVVSEQLDNIEETFERCFEELRKGRALIDDVSGRLARVTERIEAQS